MYDLAAALERVGDISQIASARPVRLQDGPDDGVRAVDVRVAGGVHALVLTDRGMDIGPAWYAGHPLAWVTGTGPARTTYGADEDFLRIFHGGLLVTAGLQNVGLPNTASGVIHGLHGRVSKIAARNVAWSVDATTGTVRVNGSVREIDVHGADLTLHRELVFRVGVPTIEIHDRVVNTGHAATPFFILYHFNIGYPLLDDGARVVAPPHRAFPFDDDARAGLVHHLEATAPRSDAAVEVFRLEMSRERSVSAEATVSVGVVNDAFPPTGGLGVMVDFVPEQLPQLWQWRMLGPRRYVMGLEPANCGLAGRVNEDESTLDVLEPGDARMFDLHVRVVTGASGW